jgi:hypothetical protein
MNSRIFLNQNQPKTPIHKLGLGKSTVLKADRNFGFKISIPCQDKTGISKSAIDL